MPFTKVRSHKLASRFAGDLRSQQQELTACVGFGESAVYPGGSVMTYRDNDRIRNPDDPWHREWGIGSIIASLVAIMIMAGILAYGATQATDMPTRSSTISQPTTAG
jgi:hypothetical protein